MLIKWNEFVFEGTLVNMNGVRGVHVPITSEDYFFFEEGEYEPMYEVYETDED